ncbi:MAG: hypothetical protein K8R21_13465 [Leptospira sp.]|nr:hypothetical protein [Leptospira sp.]
MNLFSCFILFLALQRIGELILANRNEKKIRDQGAIEYDAKGYKFIVLMHLCFFIALISENFYFERGTNQFSIYLLFGFAGTQILRYWAIRSLGERWNTKILILPGQSLIISGPYKFMNHPNYIAVILEFAIIPLLFSCYYTAILFSILNLLILKRRIGIEEKALGIKK